MNGKQAKTIRRNQHKATKQVIDAVVQKGKDDAVGYWNYLCEDKFLKRAKNAFDLLIGRKI